MSASGLHRSARRMAWRPWRNVSFASVDVETTGLDPTRDAIVSFGVVPVEAGRARLDAAVYRVARPDVELSGRSVTVHGIRPVDLDEAPSLSEEVEDLRQALQGRVILAWTAWVEAHFLGRALGGRPRRWEREIIDVRRVVSWLDALEGRGRRRVDGEELVDTAERFGVPVEDAHHALSDALMTAQLFLVVATRLETMGRGRLRSLIRGSRPTFHR
ncbi:MAG: 3'-5' exonuclease [Actinomycetota bacterium]